MRKIQWFLAFLNPCLAFEHQRLCDILERITATFSSFTNAKTHSPAEQPYSCSKCVKKFPLPHDLKEHERTHCAEPFRCLQCDKRFSLFDELKQHKRSHVGKPFNCTKCDKKFALGSDLKEHERNHTDEEPFSCLQCDKKFKHFGDMKQHWGNTCSMRLFISYSTCFILATSIKPGYRRNLVIRDKKAATNFSLITRFDCTSTFAHCRCMQPAFGPSTWPLPTACVCH